MYGEENYNNNWLKIKPVNLHFTSSDGLTQSLSLIIHFEHTRVICLFVRLEVIVETLFSITTF